MAICTISKVLPNCDHATKQSKEMNRISGSQSDKFLTLPTDSSSHLDLVAHSVATRVQTVRINIEAVALDPSVPGLAELRHAALHPLLHSDSDYPLRSLADQLNALRLKGVFVSTLHFVAHGRSGAFQFAGDWFDKEALRQSADHLKRFGVDTIALWCCNVAQDPSFLSLLEDLTRASVWASSSPIGDTVDGLHWQISRPASPRESALQPPFKAAAMRSWNHTLSATSTRYRFFNTLRSPITPPLELEAALSAVEQHLTAFILQPDALTQLRRLMGRDASESTAEWEQRTGALLEDLLSGSLSLRQEVRSSKELGGAYGAFAASGPDGDAVIYINHEWIENCSFDSLVAVVLEETGHWIDQRINGRDDTRGDEGEAFAALVLGIELDEKTLQRIASENDSTSLVIDGVAIQVELSTNILAGTGQGVNPTSSVTIDPNWDIAAWPASFTGAVAAYDGYNPVTSSLPGTYTARNGYTANGVTNYWLAPNRTATTFAPGSYNWIASQSFTVGASGLYGFNFKGTGDNSISFYINGAIVNSNTQNPSIAGGVKIGGTYNDFRKLWDFSGSAYLEAGVNTAYMVINDYGGYTGALIAQSTFQSTTSSVNSFTVNEASPYAIFSVALVSAQNVALSLANGTAVGGAGSPTDGSIDYGTNTLQYSLDNGNSWINYTGPFNASPTGGASFLVRTTIVNDTKDEPKETFSLNVTSASGAVVTGTATINDDDLTGDIYIGVTNVTVNEASPHAVFSIAIPTGLDIQLFLSNGTASGGTTSPSDGSVDFNNVNNSTTGLQYSLNNGASWINYNGARLAATLSSGAKQLLVRTALVNDKVSEGSETFTLSVIPNTSQTSTQPIGSAGYSGLATTVIGTATITDNGSGDIFLANGTVNLSAVKDDDRLLTVSSPSVLESSGYAIFSVNGAAAQLVSLALTGGTATAGPGNDFLPQLEVSTNGGTSWTLYSSGTVALSSSGSLLVRVPLISDAIAESNETLILTASNTGGSAFSGTATIVDSPALVTPSSAPDLIAASDTGVSSTDNVTSDSTPTFDIPALPAGVTGVKVYVDGSEVAAVLESNGDVTITSPLSNGSKAITYAWVDAAGNVSGQSPSLPITIDTTAPTLSGGLDAASDSGVPGDGLTNDTTPVFSGTASLGNGESLTVTVNGATYRNVPVVGGVWSIDPATLSPNSGVLGSFVNGQTYQIVATATDQAGNASTDTTVNEITIDTTPPPAPSAVLDPSSDTGVPGDGLTNDNTPTLSGTGTPGDTITVKNPAGGTIATATVKPDGTWSATPSAPLPDGANPLTITATDPAGNTGPATPLTVTVDTQPPTTPTGILDPASDSGTPGDGRTSDTTPTFTGTGTPGNTISVKDPAGNEIATATVQPNGTWSATPSTPLAETSGTFTVVQKDPAGNSSTPLPLPLTIDTTAPGAPTVTVPEGPLVNAAEATSGGGTPIRVALPSDAMAGDTVTTVVTKPDGTTTTLTSVLTAADITAGRIDQLIPTADLAQQGTWSTSSRLTDAAGNSGPAATASFAVDTLPPSAPTVTVPEGPLVNAAEANSGGGTPIQVALPANALAGDTVATVVTKPDGTTTTLTSVLTAADITAGRIDQLIPTADLTQQGSWSSSTTVIDAAGNPSPAVSGGFTLDTIAPNPPTAALDPSSDTGVQGDGITNDNTPTLSGTGTPGDTISIARPNGTVIATATVQPDGTWSATPTNVLPQGPNTLSVTAVDPAGNVSTPVNVPITIDSTPPSSVGVSVPEGPLVNIADAQSDGGTPLRVSLPANAVAGDTVTSVFTRPNGTTVTLTNTLTAADIAAGVIEQVVPTNQLTGDGTWLTSTTVTDAAGNSSSPTTSSFQLDVTPPVIPTVQLAAISDTGVTGDRLTNDSTPVLSGNAPLAPGDVLSVTINGATYGNVPVDGSGNWSLDLGTATPTSGSFSPLVSGQTYEVVARVTELSGNSSVDTSTNEVRVDTIAPSAAGVALPEAPNGVNAAEAASSGGTPLTITLPTDAQAGDSVTTTVTKPDGSSLPLTTVLTAAQISAGQITQVIPTANLDQQGTWSTSTVVTDVAGNTGPATGGSFLLDTIVPLSPTGTALPEGPQVNLADATSNGGTPLVVDLPANALVGETVTTVVTKPGGATLTLSTVLTTADLAAGSITQTIPTADLSPDGNWSTSTTLVDPSGNVSPASTNSFSLDVTPPTIAITSNRTSLIAGQTATITFTLSEASTDFTLADVSFSGGTLTGFTGSGASYSAIFTPSTNSTTPGVVSVASAAFNDAFANPNADGSDANNTVTMTVDTRVSATITGGTFVSQTVGAGTVTESFQNVADGATESTYFRITTSGDASSNIGGAFGDAFGYSVKVNFQNQQRTYQNGYVQLEAKNFTMNTISFRYWDLQNGSDDNGGFWDGRKTVEFLNASFQVVGSGQLQVGQPSDGTPFTSGNFTGNPAKYIRISGGTQDFYTLDAFTIGSSNITTTVTQSFTSGASIAGTAPNLSGTLTRALVAGESLRIKNGSSVLGNASVSGTGWTFATTIGANSTNVFTAEVVDGSGVITTSSSFTLYQSAGGVTPLALDLNGDGIQTLSLESGVAFDIDADGQRETVGWLSDGDAWLGLDRNGNGSLDSGAELFGNHTPLQGGDTAAEGFAALADLDSNGDRRIDAADARFGELLLWSDRNRDGVSQVDELTGLAQAGVVSIALDGLTDAATRQNGNWLGATGQFFRRDGSSAAITDVWVASVEPGVDPLDPLHGLQHPLLGSTPLL